MGTPSASSERWTRRPRPAASTWRSTTAASPCSASSLSSRRQRGSRSPASPGCFFVRRRGYGLLLAHRQRPALPREDARAQDLPLLLKRCRAAWAVGLVGQTDSCFV